MNNDPIASLLINSRAGACSQAFDQKTCPRHSKPRYRGHNAGFATSGERTASRDQSWLLKHYFVVLTICGLAITAGAAALA